MRVAWYVKQTLLEGGFSGGSSRMGRWCRVRRTIFSGAATWWGRPPSAYHTIEAVPRERTGGRRSARDRAMGRIPTLVLHSATETPSRKLLVTTSEKQMLSLIHHFAPSFCSTTFPLRVRAGVGSSHVLHTGTVLPIKVHRDDEGKILNLIFEWAESGSKLEVDVPIVYRGEDLCPGLLKGGYLQKIKTTLKYVCPAEHIPPTIEVDLTNKDIGDVISPSDIFVNSSLKLLSENESTPICKIAAAKLNWNLSKISEEPKPIQEGSNAGLG